MDTSDPREPTSKNIAELLADPAIDNPGRTKLVSEQPNELTSVVRVLTCGSVDDGKSTLIGRLLWDASDLFEDQRNALIRSPKRVLDGRHLDYSLLVDGLLAEQEQGITIDIAWRYFDSGSTRFVIIDCPGHEQYTRNMASGASQADVAVMVVDARHGIKRQTRRHAAILDMFGVRNVVLAVNKMDIVDWSQTRFAEIEADFAELRSNFRFDTAVAIPVAAVTGDNVADRSANMPWFTGQTLIEYLRAVRRVNTAIGKPFRFPVQMVLRDSQDFRGLAGTVASGVINAGDEIIDLISGQCAKVERIAKMDGDRSSASAGQAVALVLDRDIDISRGTILVKSTPQQVALPIPVSELVTRLVWLSEHPFNSAAKYLVRTATDVVSALLTVTRHLDLATLGWVPASGCDVNDIASGNVHLSRSMVFDAFADLPVTGSFVLVDPVSGATVAGGIVVETRHTEAARCTAFTLTRRMLASGLCKDLGDSSADLTEFQRRWAEVEHLLDLAGVIRA